MSNGSFRFITIEDIFNWVWKKTDIQPQHSKHKGFKICPILRLNFSKATRRNETNFLELFFSKFFVVKFFINPQQEGDSFLVFLQFLSYKYYVIFFLLG